MYEIDIVLDGGGIHTERYGTSDEMEERIDSLLDHGNGWRIIETRGPEPDDNWSAPDYDYNAKVRRAIG